MALVPAVPQERGLERRVVERTSELEVAKAELERRVVKDPLAQLYNCYGLMTHLEKLTQRSQQRNELLAVIMIDLDGFRPVNDQHGHEAGDVLLQTIAGRLQPGTVIVWHGLEAMSLWWSPKTSPQKPAWGPVSIEAESTQVVT